MQKNLSESWRDGGVILFGLVLAVLCFRFYWGSQHHIVSIGTWIDLGNVSLGQTSERPFPIANNSTRAVEILRWTPSCHCMQIRFEKTTLAPHEQSQAYVRTTALAPLGGREAAISIQWRYVGESFVRTDSIVASAQYVSVVALSDERLDFNKVRGTAQVEKATFVKPGNSGAKWNDLEVESNSALVSATTQMEEGGKYRIGAVLHPETLPSGVWKSQIRIFPLQNGVRTGDEVDIPVTATIQGAVEVRPSALVFYSDFSPTHAFLLRVKSEHNTLNQLNIISSVVENPKVEISGNGKEAQITGILVAPPGSGDFVGTIPIEVNNDLTKTIKVSYLGVAGKR